MVWTPELLVYSQFICEANLWGFRCWLFIGIYDASTLIQYLCSGGFGPFWHDWNAFIYVPFFRCFASLQVSGLLLECFKCGNIVHQACLASPQAQKPDGDWYCYQCAEYTSDYQVDHCRYLAEVSCRYFLESFFWGPTGFDDYPFGVNEWNAEIIVHYLWVEISVIEIIVYRCWCTIWVLFTPCNKNL